MIYIKIILWWSAAAGIFLYALGPPNNAWGFEFVNPAWLYRTTDINWLGCFLMALINSFICPIGTMAYWLFKLYVLFISI